MNEIEQMEGQMTIFDLGIWSGKTFPEPSAVTKEKTSKASLRRSSKSSNRKVPMCLCLMGGGKWSYAGCLYDYMGRWSIAWRVHDAQFWGVPQRRKRIALVADFGGMSAPEILFERTCVSGDPEQGAETGEATAGSTGEGVAAASKCLNPWEVQSKSIQDRNGIADALYSGEKTWGGGISCLYDAYQHHGYREGETCGTLTKDQNGSVRGDTPLVCYGISAYESNAMKSNNPNSGIYEADTSRTLDNNGGNPACNQGGIAVVTGAYCLQGNGIDRADTAGCNGKGWREDQSYTLNTIDRPAVLAIDRQTEPLMLEMGSTKHTVIENGICLTLKARMGTGGNNVNAVLGLCAPEITEAPDSNM